MNKSAAKKYLENNKITYGDLKKAVSDKRGSGGMSKVNPQFTLEQVLDIFDGAYKDKNDDDVVEVFVYSPRKDRLVMSSSALGAKNVIRECM